MWGNRSILMINRKSNSYKIVFLNFINNFNNFNRNLKKSDAF